MQSVSPAALAHVSAGFGEAAVKAAYRRAIASEVGRGLLFSTAAVAGIRLVTGQWPVPTWP